MQFAKTMRQKLVFPGGEKCGIDATLLMKVGKTGVESQKGRKLEVGKTDFYICAVFSTRDPSSRLSDD